MAMTFEEFKRQKYGSEDDSPDVADMEFNGKKEQVSRIVDGRRLSNDELFKVYAENADAPEHQEPPFDVSKLSDADMSMLSFEDYKNLKYGKVDPEKLFDAKLKFVGQHEREINDALSAKYASDNRREVGLGESASRGFMGRA